MTMTERDRITRAKAHRDKALTAAFGRWDPSLHPRGRDGRFIDVGALVELSGLVEAANGRPINRDGERGDVVGIGRSPDGDELIKVLLPERGEVVFASPDNLTTVQRPKAELEATRPADVAYLPEFIEELAAKFPPRVPDGPPISPTTIEEALGLVQDAPLAVAVADYINTYQAADAPTVHVLREPPPGKSMVRVTLPSGSYTDQYFDTPEEAEAWAEERRASEVRNEYPGEPATVEVRPFTESPEQAALNAIDQEIAKTQHEQIKLMESREAGVFSVEEDQAVIDQLAELAARREQLDEDRTAQEALVLEAVAPAPVRHVQIRQTTSPTGKTRFLVTDGRSRIYAEDRVSAERIRDRLRAGEEVRMEDYSVSGAWVPGGNLSEEQVRAGNIFSLEQAEAFLNDPTLDETERRRILIDIANIKRMQRLMRSDVNQLSMFASPTDRIAGRIAALRASAGFSNPDLYLAYLRASIKTPPDQAMLAALHAEGLRRGFDLAEVNRLLTVKGVTAAIKWDPTLHPRGKDGRFIETGGFVRLLGDLLDGNGRKLGRSGDGQRGEVLGVTSVRGAPMVGVRLSDGSEVFARPNTIETAPRPKAMLRGTPPSTELGEAVSRIAEVRGVEVPEPEEPGLPEPPRTELARVMERINEIRGVDPARVRALRERVHGPQAAEPEERRGPATELSEVMDRINEARAAAGDTNPLGKTPPGGDQPGSSRDNPVRTSDVNEAALALQQGKFVELETVEQLSTLLDELAAIANDAKARGDEAPHYDLCLVSVPDTNLFCAENVGIPRIQMPQLKGYPVPGSPAADIPADKFGEVSIEAQFVQHLRDNLGVSVVEGRRPAGMLKASQSELVGTKVAGMLQAMETGNEFALQNIRDASIFISNDDYVIDGHHRWAAVVGLDVADGTPIGDIDMTVRRIDMPIIEVLEEANRFANAMGIRPNAASANDAVQETAAQAAKAAKAVPEGGGQLAAHLRQTVEEARRRVAASAHQE